MPAVVLCGHPSSGKSTWATKLSDYLQQRGKQVFIVNEKDYFRGEKNDILDNSRKEKELRSKVKSESQRLVNKENVVIIDALNYIKGYRYEIYCMTKAMPTLQVTIQCEASENTAWEWNLGRPQEEQYTRPVFDHIIQRFEAPDPANRWDSPFFSILPGDDLDFEAVYNSLFGQRPPKQNLSTQSKPVSESSFLMSLEKVTSDIINTLTTELKKTDISDSDLEIQVPHSSIAVVIRESMGGSRMTLAQLMRLKRQFIKMTRVSMSNVEGNPGDLFTQYLNSQLKST